MSDHDGATVISLAVIALGLAVIWVTRRLTRDLDHIDLDQLTKDTL